MQRMRLAALVIPNLNQQQIDASWFQEQVKAAVRLAQREAVAQRRCVFVSVAPSELQLFYGDANCALTATPLTQLATGAPYALTVPGGVTLASTPPAFSFNGLGQSAGAVLDVSGRAVTVTAETGYVR